MPCRSPYELARIEYDGRVLLCQKHTIGSIYDDDLLSLWDGDRARTLRGFIASDSRICHACDYYRFCIKANEVDYRDRSVFAKQWRMPLDYDPTTGRRLTWPWVFWCLHQVKSITPERWILALRPYLRASPLYKHRRGTSAALSSDRNDEAGGATGPDRERDGVHRPTT